MAHFKYESKCAHPRKCVNLMRDFLQDACTLSYEDDDTEEEIVRKIKMRRGIVFQTFPYDTEVEYITIEYNFNELRRGNDGMARFNKNFFHLYPAARGFSSLTISLLHELGHHETLFDLPDSWDRVKEEQKLSKYFNNFDKMYQAYFSMKDEKLATQWAIDWLSQTENRKRAKRFEREFFKAWRGE